MGSFNANILFAACLTPCGWGRPSIISYLFPGGGQSSKPTSYKRDSDSQGSNFGSRCKCLKQAFLLGYFQSPQEYSTESNPPFFYFHRTQGKGQITKGITIVIKRSLLLIALLGSASVHKCATLWRACVGWWLYEFYVMNLKAVKFHPGPETTAKEAKSVLVLWEPLKIVLPNMVNIRTRSRYRRKREKWSWDCLENLSFCCWFCQRAKQTLLLSCK